MGVVYHTNAKTTIYIRKRIKTQEETLKKLSTQYGISIATVHKWKHREDLKDRSCRPHKVRTVLTELDEWIICEVRKTTLFSIDDLKEVLKPFIPHLNKDNIYRCLKRYGLPSLKEMVVKEEKEEVKEFKMYDPGYIHVDVKEMPKIKGEIDKRYLFCAIDKATRYAYISLKEDKSSNCAVEFLNEIIKFFPYKIHKLLTGQWKGIYR